MIEIQLLILLSGFVIILFYNYSDEFRTKLSVRRVSRRVHEIEKRKMDARKRRLVVAAELVVFFVLIYFGLTMKVFWAAVISNSMSPTFERGDMVLFQSISVHPEPGDIVMFDRPDVMLPVTHRVLKVEGDLVYTGGDASGPDSSPVPLSKIKAEAVMIFGKPVVVKGVGNYFILDAKEMRDITPFGQEYYFYKKLIDLFRTYAIAIIVMGVAGYLYLTYRDLID
ncbi:signal peptidase I [Geoglobus acetivorans]|uniref:Signal peptidase I n=1 Tax=Geoglobus acetivorans TaxID=565033 RepID=A0ABZ3H5M6_GEOAI|nr:signal peptidase I [Geoglobus acetivorans]